MRRRSREVDGVGHGSDLKGRGLIDVGLFKDLATLG